MTTPPGTPATPPDPDDASPSTGDGDEGGIQTPSAPLARRRRRWLLALSLALSLTVLTGGGVGWYLYKRLDGNITTDTATRDELKRFNADRPGAGPTTAENILLIGSDNRGNGNGKYGQDSGTQRSDTTILLHLAADRRSAAAVSLPRDLMARIPGCRQADGTMSRATFAQFNSAFESGGAACTIRTVEKMTDIRIDHHLIVDFSGFKKMVDAVDGVTVCVPEAIDDTKAHLHLAAGEQKLYGEQALGYVRARYSLGDGTDTQRMGRQQQFLASLVNKVRSDGVLHNPSKLYPLLSAATSSLTADPGLDSLNKLYDLVQGLQRIPTAAVRFLTVPREQYVNDHNRDQLVEPEADRLFSALRNDATVTVSPTPTTSADGTGGDGATASSSGAPTPSGTPGPSGSAPTGSPGTPVYPGFTADHDICGKAR